MAGGTTIAGGPWPRGYRRLFVARVLLRGYFFVPFIVLYARSIGVPLGTLLVVEAFSGALVVVTDLPAGVLADRIGSRQALAVGTGLEATAALVLAVTASPAVFWAVQPLFALALALTQGADAALTAALLRGAGAAERFGRCERILQSWSLGWNAVVFTLGSVLSLISFAATFLATAVVQGFAVVLVCTLPDLRTPFADLDHRATLRGWATRLRASARRSRSLRSDLLAMILSGTAFSVLLYLIPAYLVAAGIDPRLTGAATAIISLAAAGTGYLLPDAWTIGVPVVLAAVGAFLFALPWVAVALSAAVLVQAGQSRLLPRFRARAMADLGGWGEAAAMSVVTTSTSIGFAVLAPVLGLFLTRFHRCGPAVVCGLLLLGAGTAMHGPLRRHDVLPTTNPSRDAHP